MNLSVNTDLKEITINDSVSVKELKKFLDIAPAFEEYNIVCKKSYYEWVSDPNTFRVPNTPKYWYDNAFWRPNTITD